MAASNKVYPNLSTTINNSKEQAPLPPLQKMQKDVDELVEIVHDNMDQAMQRHGKLKDLNVIAGNLERGAGEFKTSSNEVKRKKWRKYMKARIICMGIAVILIIILIVLLAHLV